MRSVGTTATAARYDCPRRPDAGIVPRPFPSSRISTISPMSSTARMETTGRCGRIRSLPSRCPIPLLEGDEARAVLDAVGRSLLTSYGLRSLAPDDPAYRGTYGGDQVQRDGSYHQGPVWSWLLGPYAEATLPTDWRPRRRARHPAPDRRPPARRRAWLRFGDLRGRPAAPAERMRRPSLGRRRGPQSLAIARPLATIASVGLMPSENIDVSPQERDGRVDRFPGSAHLRRPRPSRGARRGHRRYPLRGEKVPAGKGKKGDRKKR